MDAGGPAIDAARVIADLDELERRTADSSGAQRLCWGEGWRRARDLLGELLAELGVEGERDEAGNLWARMEGEREPALTLGSHVDSVPGGGRLDGALGVLAAIGVLRAWRTAGGRPPRTLAFVDWADEEGARFGRSLFGSSAFSGTLDPVAAGELRDSEGRTLREVLAGEGVALDRVLACGRRREHLGAYLELHIEQGPVLEAEGLEVAAVAGCAGVERHRFIFAGQASHAGTTPMDARRDAGLAAADAALRIERVAVEVGGVATTGSVRLEPGIATAVAGRAELVVDLRHPEAAELAAMLDASERQAVAAADARGCELAVEPVWAIEPLPFDPALVATAREACREATGSDRLLTSGALHDAAEVSRVLPAAMIFVSSRGGISHAREEDTGEDDLVAGIEAFGLLANRVAAQ